MSILLTALALVTHPVQVHTDCIVRVRETAAERGMSSQQLRDSIETLCRATREALVTFQAARLTQPVANPEQVVRGWVRELEEEAIRTYRERTGR